mgnify:CR=1 FL=1
MLINATNVATRHAKNTSPPILPRLIIFDILITSPRVSAPTGIIANTAKRIPTSPSPAIRLMNKVFPD